MISAQRPLRAKRTLKTLKMTILKDQCRSGRSFTTKIRKFSLLELALPNRRIPLGDRLPFAPFALMKNGPERARCRLPNFACNLLWLVANQDKCTRRRRNYWLPSRGCLGQFAASVYKYGEMNPDCLYKCEKLDSIRAGKLLTIQASLPNLCTAVDQFREIFVDSVIDPYVSTIAISCSCCTCKPTKTNDATIAPMPASSATSFQLRGFIPIHWPHVRQDRCMSMECPLHKAAVHQPITQKFASRG